MASGRTVLAADSTSLRTFFLNVFAVMTVGLAITGGVAYYIAHDAGLMQSLFSLHMVMEDGKQVTEPSMSGWWIASAAIQLIMVMVLAGSRFMKLSGPVAYALFACYAGLTAVTLAPALYAYTDASVALVFFITAGTFGGAALIGHTTKTDLTPFSTFFLMALIGLLVALVANMFFQSPMMDYVISIVAVLLFSALTAYDMQKLEQMYREEGSSDGLVIYGALALYLDFLNLFLHLLRLFGVKKD